MPQASYVINLNSAGGASGSAVIDPETRKALGVLYGGGKTYVFALHALYVQYAIEALRNASVPLRKHCGIITQTYSLDSAQKHRNFPAKVVQEYLIKFPEARNKVIEVRNVISGSPAEGIVESGDILWAVRDNQTLVELGSDLSILDMAMNRSGDDKIELAIYRNGILVNKILPLYDINQNKVEKMLDFGGSLFFEADDYTSHKTGIPLKSLTIMNVDTGSSFSSLPVAFAQDNKNYYRLIVKSIADRPLKNLEDLIKFVPELSCGKQRFINMVFKNYQPYMPDFSGNDGSFISAHENLVADIILGSIDAKPRLLMYNPKKYEWQTQDISN
jgi:hypothetical protein